MSAEKKKKLMKWLKPVLFTVGGAAIGLIYYFAVGCASGSCSIASNPVFTAVYVGATGLVLSGVFTKEERD